MKKSLLLPHGFQKIGWVLLVPTLLLGIIVIFTSNDTCGLAEIIAKVIAQGRIAPSAESIGKIGNGIEPWLNNMLIIGIIAGSIFITCSREKIEDEMIGQIRLNALLMALYINFAIIIVTALLVYELQFINVMIYNLFTLPLLFLLIFRWKLRQLRKEVSNEE